TSGNRHPLREVIHEVLRGGARGVLAAGTILPPLVLDIRKQLAEHDLEAGSAVREVEIDLEQPPQRERSRILHRLRILAITGYQRTGGFDLGEGADLVRIQETWQVGWSPDFEAGCIEASRYGPSLDVAAAARLAEQAEGIERDAAAAARLLLDAAL